MKALYNRQTITELIPQRDPFVEIDEFYGIGPDGALCGLTVRPDNVLVDGEALSEAGLVEHMAQSAAARAGYVALEQKRAVETGFIGSVNNASFVRLPRVGETIQTRVELLEEVMNIVLVAVSSFIGEEQIARCTMKIVTQHNA